MKQAKHNEENTEDPIRSVLVWDLPTRLFHWLLVIFVIISFVTGNIVGTIPNGVFVIPSLTRYPVFFKVLRYWMPDRIRHDKQNLSPF